MIMHSHGQHTLRMRLTDHIIVENLENLARRRNTFAGLHKIGLVFLPDDIHAQLNAFIADEHGGPRNKLADLMLTLSAERAVQGIFTIAATRRFCHRHLLHRGATASLAPSPGINTTYRMLTEPFRPTQPPTIQRNISAVEVT